mgnify:CR=1 FL=1
MSENATSQPRRGRGAPRGNQNARKKPAIQPIAIAPVEPQPKKKRGAPLGNQNALTHGFYARRLPQSQLDGLEETTTRSLEDEIGMMRVFSRKVAELGAEVEDLGEAKSLLNTLSNATGSINRMVRTHSRLPALDMDPGAMLRRALEELELEWPELRRFYDNFRSPEEAKAKEIEAAEWMAAHPELLEDEGDVVGRGNS